jgi:predicted DNA-binding transcriptional regulator AlpA
MSGLESIKAELERHVTIEQVCEAFQISQKTLKRWRKELNFPRPSFTSRKGIRFDPDLITAWIEKQKEMAAKIEENACTQN